MRPQASPPNSDANAGASPAIVAELPPIPAVPWRTLALLLVASRAWLWLIAGVSQVFTPNGAHYTPPQSPLDWFMRWDAPWYRDLVDHGYSFTRDGDPTNVVFLPLYPALVKLATLGGLVPTPVAGYAVSLACLALACAWLWRTVAREWRDARTATLAVMFLLFGPVSFFFSTLYSEALFLPLGIGALMFAREQRWWLAGALGAAAAGTRFIGVILIVPLAWEFLAAHARAGRNWRELRLAPLCACALPLAGLAAFFALMWLQFGDPLMYFRGQLHWGRHFTWWWGLFARESYTGQPLFYQIWFAGTVIVAFGLMLLGARLRLPSVQLVFATAFGFVYISSRFVEGLPRYFSVVFPLYVVLALAVQRWPATRFPLLGSTLALQILSVTLFVNGYWFT